MREKKFTPGPWIYVEGEFNAGDGGDQSGTIRQDRPSPFHVAAIENCPSDDLDCEDGATEHNAHLIAAAPELLEALEKVVAISDRKHDAWDEAKRALSKAYGDTP